MNEETNISRRSALKFLGVGALGVLTIFNGVSCTQTNKAALENASIHGVTLRKDKVSDAMISLLGFGCMRLPLLDPSDRTGIDKEAATKMVDYAISQGINFFDTAWFYHGGNSEPFIGEALKKYPRDSFYISTKMPVSPLNSPDPNGLITSELPLDRAKEIFELQLQRCQVDYIDYYLLHNIPSLVRYKQVFIDQGVMDYILEEKAKGRIKRLGFSFHGPNEELPLIVDQYK
jgi:hypothetical protein